MILLDSNVVSELMRPEPSSVVLGWMDATPTFDVATTTITVAEIKYGLARLPFGRRRAALEARLSDLMARGFAGRVFGFDTQAAYVYAELAAARAEIGRPFGGFDGLIAAIAVSNRAVVATRDTRGFEGCGLEIVNPWNTDPA
jgi:hypothetical protein